MSDKSVDNTRSIATLLVSSPDQPGLVAEFSQLLFGHGANIVEAAQYADPGSSSFFQRVRFDVSGVITDTQAIESSISALADRLHSKHSIFYTNAGRNEW